MRSSTSTLCPAHSATWVGATPPLSHVDKQACRRSYGRRASGDACSCGVSAQRRARVLDADFMHAAFLAVSGLMVTLLGPPGHGHPHALGHRFGQTPGEVPPCAAAQIQRRYRVLPSARWPESWS